MAFNHLLYRLSYLGLAAGLAGCQSVGERPTVVNSYCQAYHRVIRTEADASSLLAADRAVKERIAINDTLYRCQCENWQNPVCKAE